jgi:hypothetical protein
MWQSSPEEVVIFLQGGAEMMAQEKACDVAFMAAKGA